MIVPFPDVADARARRLRTAARAFVFVLVTVACAIAGLATAADTVEWTPEAGTTPPRLLRLVPVQYPQLARERGIGGPVIVRARIGRDGRVRETVVAHSIPELDEAALACVRRYEFEPALLGDDEVEVWVEVPVLFHEGLPRGARGSEFEEAARYPDSERSFESDVVVLQDAGIRAPSPEDAELRAKIMAGSLKLDVLPWPGDAAIEAMRQGDSLGISPNPAMHARARLRWTAAAHLAPWWPLPYRRLASAAIADRDYGTADLCARIVLAGRPGDSDSQAFVRRARQLELGESRAQRAGSGKKKKK